MTTAIDVHDAGLVRGMRNGGATRRGEAVFSDVFVISELLKHFLDLLIKIYCLCRKASHHAKNEYTGVT